MIRNDEHWLSIVDSFTSAALGEQSWIAPIEALADASGSQGGQLVCVDSSTSIVFNILTNIDPAISTWIDETVAINHRGG
jgi:hypothetical protein